MYCIWVNSVEKRRPTFFQIYGMSVYTCIKMSLTHLEKHSQLLYGHDFANERLLICQFDAVLELIISKMKPSYLI